MKDWIPDRYRELRALIRRDRVDEEVVAELEHHLEMRTQENIEAGLRPADARAEALRRLGDFQRFKRETREIDERMRRRRRWGGYLDALRREMSVATRGLVRHANFSWVAILTLALGIGSVAAMYTVLDAIVLSPLPYAEPEELVWIDSRVPGVGPDAVWGLSQAGYFHFKERGRTLSDLGVYATTAYNLAGAEGAARVTGAAVSASLLDALKARPALGRLIEAGDDRPDAADVVVLGHAFWQAEYGGDPGVIGTTVELNAVPHEVIGVMAPGLHLADRRVEVWRPLGLDPTRPPVNAHWLSAVGRLGDGSTPDDAQADLGRLTAQFTEQFPRAYSESFMRQSGFSTRVMPLRDHVVGEAGRVLWILVGSVGLVLLIAVANVANLFLARAETRRRELAVRSALGAGRRHLFWHYLAEGVLLTLLGSVFALGLAYGATQILLAVAPSGLPRLSEFGLGWSTVAFTVGLAVAVGLFFGAFPLVQRLVDYDTLREGGRGATASRRRSLTRNGIVVAQVSLALMLMAAAGLLLRSFHQLRSVDPGLDTANVLTLEISLPARNYRSFEDVNRFYRQLLSRIGGLAEVVHVGASQKLPLQDIGGCAVVFVEDQPLEPGEQPPCVATPQMTPGFLAALGVPVRGERFDWTDVENSSGGAIVTAALAERLWSGQEAIGKGIRGNGWAQPFYRVIGVAGDIRSEGLDRPPLQAVFFPMLPLEGASLWAPPRSMNLAVKTTTSRPENLVPAIRRIMNELDPGVPVANIRTMESVVARSPAMARTSFTMLLLGIAGALALCLSVVGIYGVIAYVVGQRVSEIGIRIALGARVTQVVSMVLRRSLRLALAGILLGLLGALALSRVLRSLLFEVSPTDPVILIGVALLLLCLALAASYLPARKAARVDPMTSLRAQ